MKPAEVDEFIGKLSIVWEERYRRLSAARPPIQHIYEALDLLSMAGVELRRQTVGLVAGVLDSSGASGLSRLFEIIRAGILLTLAMAMMFASRFRITRSGRVFDGIRARAQRTMMSAPAHIETALAYLTNTEIPEGKGVIRPYEGQVDGRARKLVTQAGGNPVDAIIGCFPADIWGLWKMLALFQQSVADENYDLGAKIAEALSKDDRAGASGAIIFKAQVARLRGDAAGALTLLSTADQDWGPQKAMVLQERGLAEEAVGRLQQAVEAYTEALQGSVLPELYQNRGRVRKQMGDSAGALADFNAAVDLSPASFSGLIARAGALEDLGRIEEATVDFNRAVEIGPEGLRHRSAYRRRRKEFEGGLQDLDLALRVQPDATNLLGDRAAVLEEMGRLDQRGVILIV